MFADSSSVTDQAPPLSDSSGGQRAFGLSEMDFERGAVAMGHGAFPTDAR